MKISDNNLKQGKCFDFFVVCYTVDGDHAHHKLGQYMHKFFSYELFT